MENWHEKLLVIRHGPFSVSAMSMKEDRTSLLHQLEQVGNVTSSLPKDRRHTLSDISVV
jgi:hypothetical protein